MVIREYECDEHGYFTVERSVKDSTKEVCPVCQTAAVQVHTEAPAAFFEGTSGGIPDYHTCRSEYREWQREKFAKAQQDLHPSNVGKTVVTEESYAPKEALAAVRAKKDKAR